MNNETILHDTLEQMLPAYHLALEGKPEAGAAYRLSGEKTLFESNIPLATWEIFQVYIYQREYVAALVTQVRARLKAAGFNVEAIAAQVMQEEYYRDELRVTKLKEE